MCVWNRQLASDPLTARCWQPLLVGGMALVVAGLFGSSVVLGASLPVLKFAPNPAPCGECPAWQQDDRVWFQNQGERSLSLGEAPGADEGAVDSLAIDPEVLGAMALGAQSLLAQGDTPVVPLVYQLRDRWLVRGFFQVKIRRLTGRSDQVDTLLVDPGAAWTLAAINIDGPEFDGRSEILARWLPPTGHRYSAVQVREGIAAVLAALGDLGYPFPRWVTRNVGLDESVHAVVVNASLLSGKRCWVGPITCDLESGTASDFLVRASGLHSGELFSTAGLGDALERLRSRDLYERLSEPRVYLTESPDTVGIHFPVVAKQKVNRLQVVLGFSRANAGSPSRLSGQVDLNLPNMAGTGRKLQAGWRDDGAGTSIFGFGYKEPLLLGSALDMNTEISSEVRQDIFTRFNVAAKWELPVISLWGVGLGVGWDRSTYPVGDIERAWRNKASGSISHHRGDRLKSGWTGRFEILSAWGSTKTRIASADSTGPSQLGHSTSVRIYNIDLGGEIWLGQNMSLAGRTSYKEQTGGDTAIVPLAEQFWFGGATTLRGYNEREFHGQRVAWGSLELRIGKKRGSRLYTFWDLGYFEFATQNSGVPENVITTKGYPHGYGLGLLARTRGGDLSLAIGFPGTVDFDLAKLHVSLLESF